jgi:glycosyltransferase involved in cell wall biosynthesis
MRMIDIVPVSVVVPCYRCVATLERAVLSVVRQTQRPAEMILVDDASGDGTLDLLHSLRARYGDWVRVMAMPANAGAASTRNAGWNVATQSYIAFLDADDAWHPRKIEIQWNYMRSHPETALSGHLCRQLAADVVGSPDWAATLEGEQAITWPALLMRHQFVTPSVMLKREIDLRFEQGARYMEDHRLWLEIVSASLRTVKLHIDLVAVYKPVYGASGLSADLWGMERAELANFRHFHRQGRLSGPYLLLLQCYSLVKYLRRVLLVKIARYV